MFLIQTTIKSTFSHVFANLYEGIVHIPGSLRNTLVSNNHGFITVTTVGTCTSAETENSGSQGPIENGQL